MLQNVTAHCVIMYSGKLFKDRFSTLCINFAMKTERNMDKNEIYAFNSLHCKNSAFSIYTFSFTKQYNNNA